MNVFVWWYYSSLETFKYEMDRIRDMSKYNLYINYNENILAEGFCITALPMEKTDHQQSLALGGII